MENTATQEQYLTPEDVARRWRLKVSTILTYVRKGKLRALPGVGPTRISPREVARFERGEPIDSTPAADETATQTESADA